MECFVCGKQLSDGYLCRRHSSQLREKLINGVVIAQPASSQHCAICGSWKGKVIVEDDVTGTYFCAEDIMEEFMRADSPLD
jgi:hypothetical protein